MQRHPQQGRVYFNRFDVAHSIAQGVVLIIRNGQPVNLRVVFVQSDEFIKEMCCLLLGHGTLYMNDAVTLGKVILVIRRYTSRIEFISKRIPFFHLIGVPCLPFHKWRLFMFLVDLFKQHRPIAVAGI